MHPANSKLKTGAKGVALIKEFESYMVELPNGNCRSYWDKAGGIWTIGWGCTEPVFGEKITKTTVWTRAQAEEALRIELAKHEQFVKDIVAVELDQNEFDALVSFSYNLGPGNLKKLVEKRLNLGKRQATADAMLLYIGARVKSQSASVKRGLTRRRQAERKLFLEWTKKDLVAEGLPAAKKASFLGKVWAAILGGSATLVTWVDQAATWAGDHKTILLLGGVVGAYASYALINTWLHQDHEDGKLVIPAADDANV